MREFYGTKRLNAKPMTLGDYNKLRGWALPEGEDANKSGFLVEYIDGEGGNVEGFEGYVSWSPDEVFRDAYQPTNEMNFSHALAAMKNGHKVARRGWNGKGMFVVLMPALYMPPFNTQDTNRKVNDRTAKWIGEDQPLDCQPYFAMYTAQKTWQPGWLASQADMLADDWMIA